MAGIPEWLGPHGQSKWLEISKHLGGVPDDLAEAVCLYCEAYDDFRSALVVIAEEGVTHRIRSSSDVQRLKGEVPEGDALRALDWLQEQRLPDHE